MRATVTLPTLRMSKRSSSGTSGWTLKTESGSTGGCIPLQRDVCTYCTECGVAVRVRTCIAQHGGRLEGKRACWGRKTGEGSLLPVPVTQAGMR